MAAQNNFTIIILGQVGNVNVGNMKVSYLPT